LTRFALSQRSLFVSAASFSQHRRETSRGLWAAARSAALAALVLPFAWQAPAQAQVVRVSPRQTVPLARILAHPPSQRFQAIAQQPPVAMQLAWLMTDGTVLAQSDQGSTWYTYTPDATGSYADGTWKQVGSLQSGYDPSAFSSALLADGRLAISGGEYNGQNSPYQLQLTNLGAIYDPVAGTWTPLGHPKGWRYIGDSPNSVLPNGEFLVGQKLTTQAAYLNPKTLKWTIVPTTGKADFNAEEGWTLLPDGSVLTADVLNAPNSERYLPTSGEWVTAGSTIVDLRSVSPYTNCLQYGPKKKDCYLPPGEIGPAILRPDGTVFATGSSSGPSGSGVGHTAVYHTVGSLAGTWTVGPDFLNGDNAGDNFGTLLPSGNVLVFGNSGEMYEFNGTSWTEEGQETGSPLLLPTGQVLMLGFGVSLFNPTGQPQASWAPTITTAPTSVTHGMTYLIKGTQFNGLSQAMAFGDEYQTATNYPLVRITNTGTGHVFYARTHDHSTMGVATGSAIVSTNFDVPTKIDKGASTLQVVANGISSVAVSVTVK